MSESTVEQPGVSTFTLGDDGQATPPATPAASPPAVVSGVIVGRVELPDGGWVELGDVRVLRAKHKRQVLGNIKQVERAVAAGLDMVDGFIAMLVEAWSIPYLPNAPLPRDEPGIIGELSIPDYDALVDAVGPAQKVLFPNAPSPDQAGQPGSPTRPASA